VSKAKAKPKPAAKKRAAFLVVRTAYTLGYGATIEPIRGVYDNEPRVVPVRAFATRKAAEAFAREQDAEALAALPPPWLAELVPDFLDRVATVLAEQGLPPVAPPRRGAHPGRTFHVWWAEHAKDLSAAQKAALREPFAGMQFHHVRQIEVEG
jgi:hypothetical protein